MQDDNVVEMNIPASNPLFDWVLSRRLHEPTPYVTLSVDGIETRLALVAAPGIHQDRQDAHLSTEWRLLR